MLAIHVNSAAPFLAKSLKASSTENIKYSISRSDLYSTAISALTWRKENGEIKMVCDKVSADYYKNIGISEIWNSLEIIIPDDLEKINPLMFWAGSKIFAVRETPAPFVALDTDFIVWRKIDLGNILIAAHREDLYNDIYPPFSYFQMKNGFKFNPSYNESALPLNTAFLYFPDEDFKQYYANMSIEFMKSSKDIDDNLRYMVFAEQRLLAILADMLNVKTKTLLEKDKIFFPQENFTHLWGAKKFIRENKSEEDKFCRRCADRIRKDFPEYAYIIEKIDNN